MTHLGVAKLSTHGHEDVRRASSAYDPFRSDGDFPSVRFWAILRPRITLRAGVPVYRFKVRQWTKAS